MKKIFYLALITLLLSGCRKKDNGGFSSETTFTTVEVSDGTCVITYGVDLKKEMIFYPVSILLPDSTYIRL
jgi:hypothetical protein